jgi:hypothetical protein
MANPRLSNPAIGRVVRRRWPEVTSRPVDGNLPLDDAKIGEFVRKHVA